MIFPRPTAEHPATDNIPKIFCGGFADRTAADSPEPAAFDLTISGGKALNGILNLRKPGGITSHDCVSMCRRLFGTRRVGHAGTLDPMATGVLPVLIGNACAAQGELTDHDKTYTAGVRFGIVTDTEDITGEVLRTSVKLPTESEVLAAVSSFVGEDGYDQIPPMYSALKVGGRKLCDLAREGKNVERKARRIIVYGADIIERVSDSDYIISFSVSKGTYIRTLAADIGEKLGCGACLYSLERTVCGEFEISDSVTLEELAEAKEKHGTEHLEKYLIPCEKAFAKYPSVKLSEFYSRLCKNGCEIYLAKAKIPDACFSENGRCRLYSSDGRFFAIGERRTFPDGDAVKAIMRFDIER